MTVQTPTWASVQASWSRSWKHTAREAITAYSAEILATPERFKQTVEGFLSVLGDNAKTLQSDRDKLLLLKAAAEQETALRSDYSKRVKQWLSLERDNQQLAAGLLADATHAEDVGAAPVLIVAGIAVSVAGIAWAIAAGQYATAHRERIALFSKELDARVTALNLGQTLPATTIPGSLDGGKPAGSSGLIVGLLSLAAVAGGGALLYRFAR